MFSGRYPSVERRGGRRLTAYLTAFVRNFMHPMLNIAIKAARRAGTIINRASLDLERLNVARKGPRDYVTEVDRAAEESIVETLRAAYPDHAVLGENSACRVRIRPSSSGSSIRWTAPPTSSTACRTTRCRSR